MWRSFFNMLRRTRGPGFQLAWARVLLLEELVDTRRTLACGLSAAGVDVDLECDRRSAEEAVLRKGKHWYDAIICRISWPLRERAEFAVRLQRLGVTRPIVILASKSEIDACQECDRRLLLIDSSSLSKTLQVIVAELTKRQKF